MNDITAALRASALLATVLALAGCSGDRMFGSIGSSTAPAGAPSQPGAPPVNLGGRWLLSSPGRGQCHITFGAASPSAAEGTIAPEGGCPGKFFTSRKWTYDQNGLTMRDHNGQPLAQLSGAGGQFNGKATAGEPVTLMR
jgi:hypothetical protein